MLLDPDFSEFIACCVQREVRFLVVGGYAVAAHGPPAKRIDLLTSTGGVTFDECWPPRVEIDIGGLAVPFIDPGHLVLNKRAAGRLQDLADAEGMSRDPGDHATGS